MDHDEIHPHRYLAAHNSLSDLHNTLVEAGLGLVDLTRANRRDVVSGLSGR